MARHPKVDHNGKAFEARKLVCLIRRTSEEPLIHMTVSSPRLSFAPHLYIPASATLFPSRHTNEDQIPVSIMSSVSRWQAIMQVWGLKDHFQNGLPLCHRQIVASGAGSLTCKETYRLARTYIPAEEAKGKGSRRQPKQPGQDSKARKAGTAGKPRTMTSDPDCTQYPYNLTSESALLSESLINPFTSPCP
jgi:hypothetical protein